jgi:methionine salvage enolase-phosphatase E1
VRNGAVGNTEKNTRVFEDVVPFLGAVKKLNIPTYIYSSGSIEAQKLIFGFSTKGVSIDYTSKS